jgi:hypothetical protein
VAVSVLVLKLAVAVRKTVVDPETLNRCTGATSERLFDAAWVALFIALIPLAPFAPVVVVTAVWAIEIIVPAADINSTFPLTSQSPAVSTMLVILAVVPLVRETPVPVAVRNSPILPAFALSAAVVPLIPTVLDGEIRPDAAIVENDPAVPVTLPENTTLPASSIDIGVALFVLLTIWNAPLNARMNLFGVVAPLPPRTIAAPDPVLAVALTTIVAPLVAEFVIVTAPVKLGDAKGAALALHVKPVPLVYCSALVDVEQLGIANAVGDALDPVTFATTVFAACAASAVAVTFDHAGAVLGPVDTIAWPAVDPAGLINETGDSVAAKAVEESAISAASRSLFI